MLYFTADYRDREQLLKLGAKWDCKLWRWRADNYCDYKRFAKWIDGRIITDELCIIEAEDVCPFCGKPVKLEAVACGDYREDFLPVVFGKNCINFLYGFENVSEEIARLLKENFALKQRYVQAYGYKYLCNGCAKCGKAFPDEYLFADESSPFFADCAERAQKLKIYRYKPEFDIALNGKIAFSFEKPLFADCKTEEINNFDFFSSK